MHLLSALVETKWYFFAKKIIAIAVATQKIDSAKLAVIAPMIKRTSSKNNSLIGKTIIFPDSGKKVLHNT